MTRRFCGILAFFILLHSDPPLQPARDEEGNEINPHIPSWMASAPWYLDNSNKPSLKHQRLRQDGAADSLNDQWYQRGLRAGPAATTYVSHRAFLLQLL